MKKIKAFILICCVFVISINTCYADACYDRIRNVLVSYFGEPDSSLYYPGADKYFQDNAVTVFIYIDSDKRWQIDLAKKDSTFSLTVLYPDAQNAEDVFWFLLSNYEEYQNCTVNKFIINMECTYLGKIITINSSELANSYLTLASYVKSEGKEVNLTNVMKAIEEIKKNR